MLDHVLVLEIDTSHVEFVCADHFVTENSLVHDLDRDCLHLDLARMLFQKSIGYTSDYK